MQGACYLSLTHIIGVNMAKWAVKFDVRKGNNTMHTTENVDAETEAMAVRIAEGKSKSNLSAKVSQGYIWNLLSVIKK